MDKQAKVFMKKNYSIFNFTLVVLAVLYLNIDPVFGQCPNPRLYDLNYTTATNNPQWENCIDNSALPDQFNLPLISPVDIHNYVLDFGDGTTPLTGTLWPANTPINHTFDLGIYNITLSETNNGCTVTMQGRLVNDRKAGATAIPPTIGTTGCVPHTLSFVNQSTNTSPFTVFEWNWGDGIIERVGANTVGQSISHVYQKGMAGCNMVVSLTAYSLCDTTFSSYGPYDFWDIDTAVVAASATRICVGQEVTFSDQTLYNCNVRQPRKIRWNFSELGGPVTGWLPAIPVNRSQSFFVTGNVGDRFTVFMEDSNYCGVDPTAVTVEIIAPPTAGINLPNPTICAGQEAVFLNTSSGGDLFRWEFGDGSNPLIVGNQSQVRHTYNTPGIYTVKQVAQISGTDFCKDSITVTIEVLPSSVSDYTANVYSGCAPLQVAFADNSSNAENWEWDLGNGTTYSGINPPTQIYAEPGTYIVELNTSNSLGCGSKKTATISVFPSVISIPEGDSVCLGNGIKFLDQSLLNSTSSCSVGNILYEKWNNISGSSVTDLTNSTDFPANPNTSTLINSMEASLNNGDNFGARIHGFICPPQTGNYLFWIASDDQSELWLSTDSDPSNSIMIAEVKGGYTGSREWNKYTSQQSLPVILEAGKRYYINALHKENNGGDNLAVGWQLPSGIRERPIPGSRLAPYAEGSSIISRTWDFGNGTTSNNQNPEYIYPVAGDYDVTLTVSTGKCVATETVKVKIFPDVSTSIWQSDTAACSPLNLEMTALSVGADNLIWNFGDGTADDKYNVGEKDTITHQFINNSGANREYYLSLIAQNSFGCSDTAFSKVKVFPAPKADFTFSPGVPQCSPAVVNFINTSEASDTYKWYFGLTDSISTSSLNQIQYSFENQRSTVENISIRLKSYSNNGCYGEVEKFVTVYPKPNFEILADPDTTCHPAKIQLSVTGSPVQSLWNLGDGSTNTSPALIKDYFNSGIKDTSYHIEFIGTSAFNCRDTANKTIVVQPKPSANFIANINSGCSPLTVNFENLSSGGIYSVFSYGDGIIDTVSQTNHAYVFRNTENSLKEYQVTLKVVNTAGCVDEKSISITVFPEVRASIKAPVVQGCSPLNVNLENASTGANIYQWNFGDGSNSNLFAPTHTFDNSTSKDTIYTVTMLAISTFGCQNSDSLAVTVFSNPVSNFVADINSGCSPLTVNFNNLAQNADSIVWNFGDGIFSSELSDSPQFLFKNTDFIPKEFTVTQTAFSKSKCKATSNLKITVNPEVLALLASSDTAGCAPWSVNFYNTSVGASSYLWDFGDIQKSILKSPSHVFENESNINDSIYTVTLVASNAWTCKDTIKQQIQVFPNPKTEYWITNPIGCTPHKVIFSNNSIGATNYQWNFGNGLTNDTSEQVFAIEMQNSDQAVKTNQVKLTSINEYGCTSSLVKEVTIYPKVVAQFESVPSGCTPFHVALKNTTIGSSSYFWQMGDGQTSTEFSPAHTYSQITTIDTIFTIKLIATSTYGCVDTLVKQITVFSKPIASFIASPKTLQLPDTTVSITNNSSIGNWQYSWDFGDGTKSELKHPNVHHYNFYGTYKIKLIVTGDNCLDSISQFITVLPTKPIAEFSGQAEGCSPVSVQFTNHTKYADRFEWEFGDGQTSSQKNPKHIYDYPGEYSVILRAFGEGGTDMTIHQNVVKVYAIPSAFFQVKPDDKEVKIGNAHYFSNLSEGATNFTWNFGDGSTSSERSPFHEYNKPGIYDVILIASNENGCINEHQIKSAATVAEGGKILIPNAFTPGGGGNILSSGMNDYFTPIYEGVTEFHMQIFNRWGELLFETHSSEPGWDGTYRGLLCKQDVYVYKIKAKFVDGETIEKIGDVTLIR